jgi:2-dehydro-3-deoxy-D-arabinonate dehydratase
MQHANEGSTVIAIDLVAARHGLIARSSGEHRRLAATATIDALLASADPIGVAADWFAAGTRVVSPADGDVRAPIGSQEVWAAGVTYLRSRAARVAESRESGGDTFYDLVYDAERPELFFKATPNRVVGHGGNVRIRRDSTWNVPEPELTLVVSSRGRIVGHTIGNDMSSRSIEGENPLYLPQAKVYAGCASLGPWLVLTDELPGGGTSIEMSIVRGGTLAFAGTTTVDRIRRPFGELVEYLFRDNHFPTGVFLMTGTGIVPDDDFTLLPGDEIRISIDGAGTLINHVTVGD